MYFSTSSPVRRFVLLPAVLLAVLAASGCDTSFEAFKETERAYSVFGTLDASADTQFVRVEPIQDSTFAGTELFDARVTSEHLATGEQVLWRDSTFQIGDSVFVHNFWTAADLAPESTHRFRVERERDGVASTAEVTLPAAFPPPDVRAAPNLRDTSTSPRPPTQIMVEGVERLGGVRADYDYRVCIPTDRGCNYVRRQVTAYPLAGATRIGEASWRIEVYWDQDIPDVGGPDVTDIETIYSFRVTVAAASEDWPSYAEDNLPGGAEGEPLPPPGINSNIENGVGFLGGAFTRTVEVPVRQ